MDECTYAYACSYQSIFHPPTLYRKVDEAFFSTSIRSKINFFKENGPSNDIQGFKTTSGEVEDSQSHKHSTSCLFAYILGFELNNPPSQIPKN